MMRWLRLLPLFGLLCACNVASVREAPNTIAYNECQSDDDCPEGVCVNAHSALRSGLQCRSRSGELQKILFEVTPPADNSPIAGVQYLIPSEDLSTSKGIVSLDLDAISQIVGKVKAPKRECSARFVSDMGTLAIADDRSVPAQVSLIPTSNALGLYSPRSVAQPRLIDSIYWAFSTNLPPGTYDIYVEPKPQPDDSCPVPPQLVRANVLKPGPMSLELELPLPSMFEFHVTWPHRDGALKGWMVDMLEPTSGRVISNRVPLALSPDDNTDYHATLAYSAVTGAGEVSAQKQEQLIRLSPPDSSPESSALPTVILARSALALFDAGRGTLTDFTTLPSPVHVVGQVTSGDSPTPVPATVTLVANVIQGITSGVLASFVRTVSVGADGQFDVYLLPGKYTVSTVPLATLELRENEPPPLAANSQEWIVASSPAEQAGKVIDLGSALPLTGQVFDAADHSVATAQVQAVASQPSIRYDVLQQTVGGTTATPHPAFVPRASAGAVGSTGEFALRTDPGTFDISVRPNDDTGFAWLVMPNVAVTDPSAGVWLGRINMPQPVSYRGTVMVGGSDTSNPIPSALVRAYVYLKGGQYTSVALEADSVLQVAETRADENGAFEILIPARLNHRDE